MSHHSSTVPPSEAAGHGVDRKPQLSAFVRGALVPLVVGLAIGGLFVGVFLAAFHDPRPSDLPVAVVAPPQVLTAVQDAASSTGALEVTSVADRETAAAVVRDRSVLGALVVGPTGSELLVAGANGPSVTQTLQGAFGASAEAAGTPLITTDVAPLSEGDSRGLSIFYGAFGVVLAGFLFGQTSMQIGRDLPLRWRAASAVAFSAVVGLVVAWLLQPVFGALPAPFWTTAAVVAMLALAVGSSTAAMLSLLGPAGTFVASVVLLVLGNATSTGILPAQYLPAWLEPLAPVLPVGVAVRALRGAAYFDGDGLLVGLAVLTAWIAAAWLLLGLGARRRSRDLTAPANPAQVPAA